MTAGMPDAYGRVQAAIDTQLAQPTMYADLADAACTAVLDIAREMEDEHPRYAEAFQALAERLGYV